MSGWSQQDLRVLQLMVNDLTNAELARAFGCSENNLRAALEWHRITRNAAGRRMLAHTAQSKVRARRLGIAA